MEHRQERAEKIKILLVDDYDKNVEALKALVASDDVEVFTASCAEEALELISRHDFGLALLDINMPETSGLELAKLIRGVKKYRALPIIFVTAHSADNELVFEGYESGAVDLLFKPLNPKIVRAKVNIFVELAQQRGLLQKQVEELDRLRRAADSANLAKSRFLANMSHEIRTPLAAVMGFSDLLSAENVSSDEKSDFTAAIKKNGKLLMRLIDDILEFSKIEANQLKFDKKYFEMKELLSDVRLVMSRRAKENGVTLNFIFSEEELGQYLSDIIRVKQILLNIIGNAIKFSPNGRVDVECKVLNEKRKVISERSQLFHTVQVSVKDNGVGISAAQARQLFTPFSQADSSTTRKFGGTGLGLTISQQIAKALGGGLKLVRSEIGEGSTFEISFEFECKELKNSDQPLENSESDSSSDLRGKRVLAIDDMPENLTILSYYLKGTGIELVKAHSGEEGLKRVYEDKFDLILVDIQMPGIDGHETTRRIRQEKFRKPVIALTAHALASEKAKCIESGCDDVLTKPLARDVLIDKVSRYLSSHEE